jgi:hypothetical protein
MMLFCVRGLFTCSCICLETTVTPLAVNQSDRTRLVYRHRFGRRYMGRLFTT